MNLKKISKLKDDVEKILNDNKALEVKSIDLLDKTTIVDFMIIASGNSSKHIQSLAQILLNELKKKGYYIKAGDIIMTGSPIKSFFIKKGDKVKSVIDRLGSVNLNII